MTSRPNTSKLLLVAEARARAADDPKVTVRRYRLARIVARDRAADVTGSASCRD